MAQLCCKNLTLGYDSNVLVTNLNFSVNKGEYLCILGENGAGKSTLMKAILGLKKQLSGEIIWGDGVSVGEIGYLTQQSEIQKEFPASVKEIVLSGFQTKLGIRPFYTKAQKIEAMEIMEKMGITQFAKRCYRELSGGQQQRVLLSRALCATQKILFLDEPVAGLDPKITEQMYQLIENLNIKYGVTIIMISHDVEIALKYATHVLKVGKDYFFGTKDEFLSQKIGGEN